MNYLNYKKVPSNPGVYLFKDKNAKVIYVGKAKDLKKRLSFYFKAIQPAGDFLYEQKTRQLADEIDDIKYIITDNEKEALLLEEQLIQKYQPKFNIDLKDSRRYAYLKITKEKFPRLLVAREKKGNDSYFGPYTNAQARVIAMKLARELFKIRTCKILPKKACLRFYIHLCDAPCIGNISTQEYNININKAKKFLRGSTGELVNDLQREMKEFIYHQEYEKAKILRDQIYALEDFSQKQKVILDKKYSEDVINYEIAGDKIYFQVFNIKRGVVLAKNEYMIKSELDSEASESNSGKSFVVSEFIRSYYSKNQLPDEIILPTKLFDQNELAYWLELKYGSKVRFFVPQKGNKLKLLNLVKQNIQASMREENPALVDLQEVLSLPTYPSAVECFDVSNMGKRINVGSMVYFKNGKPDKNNYRRFKIRAVPGQDDYLSMAELISRRYLRLMRENRPMPDLIIVDGGKGQVNVALKILNSLELDIPLIGIAKKNEEIFLAGKTRPLILKRNSPALKMIQQIRDEAHRFAIKYHRILRNQEI